MSATQRLINLNDHKRNTSVLVNGTTYRVDAEGVVSVSGADAAKLLSGRNWKKYDGRSRKEVLADFRSAQRQQLQQGHDAALERNVDTALDRGLDRRVAELVDQRLREMGLSPQDLRAEHTKSAQERFKRAFKSRLVDDEAAAQAEVAAKGAPDAEDWSDGADSTSAAPDTEPPTEPELAGERYEGTDGTVWVVPVGNDEWPDLDPRMPMKYLRKYADAYEVSHSPNMKPETLLKRLEDAVYDPAE